MSGLLIALVPKDPRFVPDDDKRLTARDRLSEVAPDADKIWFWDSEAVEFFSCAAGLDRIGCPSCGAEVPLKWWDDRLDEDYKDKGFQLTEFATPCCGTMVTLNDLVYDRPQAFGRFALVLMNPCIATLDDINKQEKRRVRLDAPQESTPHISRIATHFGRIRLERPFVSMCGMN